MGRLTAFAGVGLLALSLTVAGCTAPLPSKEPANTQTQDQSRPATELLARMLDLIDETTKFHGGQWTYSDEQRSPWDSTKTSGFMADTCTRLKPGSGENRAYRYSMMVLGPAVEDPEAAVAEYVAHFGQQGFAQTNRYSADVPESNGSGYYIMVSLEDAEGTSLFYQAGNHLSSLTFEGQCSYDPAMEFPTP